MVNICEKVSFNSCLRLCIFFPSPPALAENIPSIVLLFLCFDVLLSLLCFTFLWFSLCFSNDCLEQGLSGENPGHSAGIYMWPFTNIYLGIYTREEIYLPAAALHPGAQLCGVQLPAGQIPGAQLHAIQVPRAQVPAAQPAHQLPVLLLPAHQLPAHQLPVAQPPVPVVE